MDNQNTNPDESIPESEEEIIYAGMFRFLEMVGFPSGEIYMQKDMSIKGASKETLHGINNAIGVCQMFISNFSGSHAGIMDRAKRHIQHDRKLRRFALPEKALLLLAKQSGLADHNSFIDGKDFIVEGRFRSLKFMVKELRDLWSKVIVMEDHPTEQDIEQLENIKHVGLEVSDIIEKATNSLEERWKNRKKDEPDPPSNKPSLRLF